MNSNPKKRKRKKKIDVIDLFIANKTSIEKPLSKEAANMLGYNNWNSLYGGIR